MLYNFNVFSYFKIIVNKYNKIIVDFLLLVEIAGSVWSEIKVRESRIIRRCMMNISRESILMPFCVVFWVCNRCNRCNRCSLLFNSYFKSLGLVLWPNCLFILLEESENSTEWLQQQQNCSVFQYFLVILICKLI